MFIASILVCTLTLAAPAEWPSDALETTLDLVDTTDPTEARYPPGHCLAQMSCEGGCPSGIEGQCVAFCGMATKGTVVDKRYLDVSGEHDDWCKGKASSFCDALGYNLASWCWGEED